MAPLLSNALAVPHTTYLRATFLLGGSNTRRAADGAVALATRARAKPKPTLASKESVARGMKENIEKHKSRRRRREVGSQVDSVKARNSHNRREAKQIQNFACAFLCAGLTSHSVSHEGQCTQ